MLIVEIKSRNNTENSKLIYWKHKMIFKINKILVLENWNGNNTFLRKKEKSNNMIISFYKEWFSIHFTQHLLMNYYFGTLNIFQQLLKYIFFKTRKKPKNIPSKIEGVWVFSSLFCSNKTTNVFRRNTSIRVALIILTPRNTYIHVTIFISYIPHVILLQNLDSIVEFQTWKSLTTTHKLIILQRKKLLAFIFPKPKSIAPFNIINASY